MSWSNLILLLCPLHLLPNSSKCLSKVSNMNVGNGSSKAKSEQVLLDNFRDLKSSVNSLQARVGAFETRMRNDGICLNDSDVKTAKKLDVLETMLQDLSNNVPEEGQKAQHPKNVLPTANLQGWEREIKLTNSLIRGLESPLKEIRGQLGALLEESRQERVARSKIQADIMASLQTLQTVVNLTSTSNHKKARKGVFDLKKGTKEMLLKNPKATFFTGENLTGEPFEYDSTKSNSYGGWKQVYYGPVKSMRLSNVCVRVFKNEFCEGISLALYPKPDSGSFINFLSPELPSVRCIGPCFLSEFQHANVSLNGTSIVVTKNESDIRHVPDFVDVSGDENYYFQSKEINSKTNTIRAYYMDQGRPKWIKAEIQSTDLNNSVLNAVGLHLAIPAELGGPTNEAYNTFPQSQKNFEEWKEITDQIQSLLRDNAWNRVTLYFTFVYESPTVTTKPYGFYYHLRLSFFNNVQILYGFIEN